MKYRLLKNKANEIYIEKFDNPYYIGFQWVFLTYVETVEEGKRVIDALVLKDKEEQVKFYNRTQKEILYTGESN